MGEEAANSLGVSARTAQNLTLLAAAVCWCGDLPGSDWILWLWQRRLWCVPARQRWVNAVSAVGSGACCVLTYGACAGGSRRLRWGIVATSAAPRCSVPDIRRKVEALHVEILPLLSTEAATTAINRSRVVGPRFWVAGVDCARSAAQVPWRVLILNVGVGGADCGAGVWGMWGFKIAPEKRSRRC